MTSVVVTNQRKIDIYFKKRGRIDIMANVVRTLGLQDGDAINVLCHDDECYLYVSARRSNLKVADANYVAQAHPTNKGSHNYRCQCLRITQFINDNLTKAEESWLFVGTPKDLSIYGIDEIGVPLIYKNNRYGNKNY